MSTTSSKLFALGVGIATLNRNGEFLEAFFPEPLLNPQGGDVAALLEIAGYKGGNRTIELSADQLTDLRRLKEPYSSMVDSTKPVVLVVLEEDTPPVTVPEVYLKLHLLSHRLVKPHGTNLTGIFKILPNVAWTNRGAIDLEELPRHILQARLRGETLSVDMVDKFPKMTDYVVPSGVRIADTARVRLGAYLGEGTTIMQEGFVNFNAGTEGPNMIEGRVSSSVWIGTGSDLGGGSSTMGVLSGGNSIPISVGKNCLIGANAGLGIPLGDQCTIESGLYLTAASKVRIVSRDGKVSKTMKALDLAGRSGLLFRRNSQDGAIECLPIKQAIALNEDLHSHN